jgi:glutathione S-transferase
MEAAMLTLYHAPLSRSSRIVWLLEELAADYELVYVDIRRMDGSGGTDPRNPHPDGKVPALVHDGALVTESAAVVLYLTDLHPTAAVSVPVGDPRRGAYLSWLAYYAGVMEPVVHFEFLGLGDNEALRRTFRGRAELDRRVLGALERHPYVTGDSFTGADLLVASMGAFMRPMLPAGAVVDDYLARCEARPARQAALAKDRQPAG